MKVENFVFGIVRFVTLYARTTFLAVVKPWAFNVRLAQARRHRRVVPPLTFLIVGCFFFSILIDTYAEGWLIYFNWIWLDDEISQKINERGADLFSLTAIVRSGLPTFLCFAVLAQLLSILLSRSRWVRPRVSATIAYAFGLHATAFGFACFLPIVGNYALNPETSDSVVSDLWQYGIVYLVAGATIMFGTIAFISPILLIGWSAHRREARQALKPAFVRVGLAFPIFFTSIFIATEFGSIPARFTSALKPLPKVEYQAMQGPRLYGRGPGDISGATYAILFHNKTEDLAYIDTDTRLVDVTINLSNGIEIPTKDNIQTKIFDENRVAKTVLPVLPGKTQFVYFEMRWEIDGTLGIPTDTYYDGSWSYDGLNVILDFDPITGADFDGDLIYNLGSPSIHPW